MHTFGKQNIDLRKSEKPSRFLVDLNFLDKEETAGEKKNNFLGKLRENFDVYDDLKKAKKNKKREVKRIKREKMARGTLNLLDFIQNFSNLVKQNLKSSKTLAVIDSKFGHLALYPLIKSAVFLFFNFASFLFKASYYVGVFFVNILTAFIYIVNKIISLKIPIKYSKLKIRKKVKNNNIKFGSRGLNEKDFSFNKFEEKSFYTVKSLNKVVLDKLAEEREKEKLQNIQQPKVENLYNLSSDQKLSNKRGLPSNKDIAGAGFHFKINKSIFVFGIILVLIVLPIKIYDFYKTFDAADVKGRVLGASEMAFDNLKDASKSMSGFEVEAASEKFNEAGVNFSQAQAEVSRINDLFLSLGKLIPNKKIKLASHGKDILEAGELGSKVAGNLAESMEVLFLSADGDLIQGLKRFEQLTMEAHNDAVRIDSIVKGLNVDIIPDEYKANFIMMKNRAGMIAAPLKEVSEFSGLAAKILGGEQKMRYLIVFQNNAEMRASGGFIGSFALVDFMDGRIVNLEVPEGGSYDTEGGLKERIVAPKPLWLVNPLWHFWDSNWWPDWPTSARKLAWFYEKSGGPTVDGVISVTPTVFENLLGIIGPIDMKDKYGEIINKDNFYMFTQEKSEEKGTTTSKKIIGDLFKKVIEVIPQRMNKDMAFGAAKLFSSSLDEKQVQFYFDDKKIESKMSQRGWAGEIKDTAYDYLMVVNSNIAGGKSDRWILQKIKHKIEVMPDGSIIDTLVISRQHTAKRGEKFGGVRNNDWLRVYVPKGSELLSASGFSSPPDKYFQQPDPSWMHDSDLEAEEVKYAIDENSKTKIYDEGDKTVFANWVELEPEQMARVVLKYKLPFVVAEKTAGEISSKDDGFLKNILIKLNPGQVEPSAFSLFVQKQPGEKETSFISELALPKNFKTIWNYPSQTKENGWSDKTILDKDKYWAAAVQKIGG